MKKRKLERATSPKTSVAATAAIAIAVVEEGGKGGKVETTSQRRRSGKPKKRKLCHKFTETGTCKFGNTCRFAHGEGELKRKHVALWDMQEERDRLADRVQALERREKERDGVPFYEANMSRLVGSVVDRHYTELFYIRKNSTEDQYVNVHKNGLCLIGLAPGHPAISNGRSIRSVVYEHDMSKISGKKKRGAPRLLETSKVCVVTCDDDSKWCVLSGVKGGLWEINGRLEERPSLLATRPRSEGFIGVVKPKHNSLEELKHRLFTRAEFRCFRSRSAPTKGTFEMGDGEGKTGASANGVRSE